MKFFLKLLLLLPMIAFATNKDIERFATHMESAYQFDRADIRDLIRGVTPLADVIRMFKRPATRLSYDKFEMFFINEHRITNGVHFWNEHEEALAQAEQIYGVPADVIVALIGVETSYGVNVGKFKVIESLVTLGFYGPRRREYFQFELQQFLITARNLNWNRDEIVGSFAGAIGIPQFMPSNIEKFARDFNDDGQVDLINDKSDAIGSVANYLKMAGWTRNEPIAIPLMKNDRKRGHVLVFKTLPGPTPTRWKATNNFNVIKRYNPSNNYAMTIFVLAEKIKERRNICTDQNVLCGFP